MNTAVALLAATLLLAACGKKEEAAPAAGSGAAAGGRTGARAGAGYRSIRAATPEENSEDAEQSGGDKVKP